MDKVTTLGESPHFMMFRKKNWHDIKKYIGPNLGSYLCCSFSFTHCQVLTNHEDHFVLTRINIRSLKQGIREMILCEMMKLIFILKISLKLKSKLKDKKKLKISNIREEHSKTMQLTIISMFEKMQLTIICLFEKFKLHEN